MPQRVSEGVVLTRGCSLVRADAREPPGERTPRSPPRARVSAKQARVSAKQARVPAKEGRVLAEKTRGGLRSVRP